MQRFLITAALAAGLVSVPASAKVVAEGEGAFVTRDTAVVTADLRETWLSLISPAKWWNSAHTFSGDSANMTMTPQAGGCFCERIPADDTAKAIGLAGSVEHMSVILAIPDQALRMEGALGPLQSEPVKAILTVTLTPVDRDTEKGAPKGTRITFEYAVAGFMRYEIPVISKAVDGVLSQQLAGLAGLLGPVDDPAGEAAPKKPAKETAPSDAGATLSKDASDKAALEALGKARKESGKASDTTPAAEEDPVEPKLTVDEAFGDFGPKL